MVARVARVVVATCLAFAATACNGSSNRGTSSEGDGGCPSTGCNCFRDGGIYQCGNMVVPACPTNTGVGASCNDLGSSCYICQQGAGIHCQCMDAGVVPDGGVQWLCIGTEYPCTGG